MVCVCVCVRVYVRMCVRACVRACVYVGVYIYVCVCLRAFVLVCVSHTSISECMTPRVTPHSLTTPAGANSLNRCIVDNKGAREAV